MPSPTSATCSTRLKLLKRSRRLLSKFLLTLEARIMRVHGRSMTPALHPNDLILVQQDGFSLRPPRRGDLVAVCPDVLGGRAIVKRLIGLPQDVLKVNGREWRLSDGEFFVVGDQQEGSLDSRVFGPVRRQEMIGPVQGRLWPIFRPLDAGHILRSWALARGRPERAQRVEGRR